MAGKGGDGCSAVHVDVTSFALDEFVVPAEGRRAHVHVVTHGHSTGHVELSRQSFAVRRRKARLPRSFSLHRASDTRFRHGTSVSIRRGNSAIYGQFDSCGQSRPCHSRCPSPVLLAVDEESVEPSEEMVAKSLSRAMGRSPETFGSAAVRRIEVCGGGTVGSGARWCRNRPRPAAPPAVRERDRGPARRNRCRGGEVIATEDRDGRQGGPSSSLGADAGRPDVLLLPVDAGPPRFPCPPRNGFRRSIDIRLLSTGAIRRFRQPGRAQVGGVPPAGRRLRLRRVARWFTADESYRWFGSCSPAAAEVAACSDPIPCRERRFLHLGRCAWCIVTHSRPSR